MTIAKRLAVMEGELIRLMPVAGTSAWGPNPTRCRWCAAWLNTDDGRPYVEAHARNCFAVTVLGRPSRKVEA